MTMMTIMMKVTMTITKMMMTMMTVMMKMVKDDDDNATHDNNDSRA